jgi:hypothetical protein
MRCRKPVTILLPIIVVFLFGGLPRTEGKSASIAGNPAQEQRVPNQEPDSSKSITLTPGTTISVRIADTVNSSHNHAGDLITGTVDPSVFINNQVVIPRGTEAHMRVMEDRKGGRLHGKAPLRLELVGLVINKNKLDIESDDYSKKQGVLSAKLNATGKASVDGGSRAATSATPEGGAVSPIIAVFSAAKIELSAGIRIPFTLMSPFTFDVPDEPPATRP